MLTSSLRRRDHAETRRLDYESIKIHTTLTKLVGVRVMFGHVTPAHTATALACYPVYA